LITSVLTEGTPEIQRLSRRMLGGGRLILASNRGPIEHHVSGGCCEARQGEGGLAVALCSAAHCMPLSWVASAMTEGDRQVARRNSDGNGTAVVAGDDACRLRMVLVSKETYDRYYNLMSNAVLWFIQHSLWDSPCGPRGRPNLWHEIQEGWDFGYVPVNQAFAEAVLAELAQPDAAPCVMFHDYHLYLAPSYVRRRAPGAVLAHFGHIPWPPPDAWQQLPWAISQSVIEGLLACDLVGFQTPESAHNFLLSCYDYIRGATVHFEDSSVTLDGHRTVVRPYPISVDVAALRNRMVSRAVKQYKTALASNGCPRTIVRVDRMDPAKNILLGFEAFDLLLETNPELVGRVRFLAFLVPSRQAVPEYKCHAEAVLSLADHINRRWGTEHWQPIQVFYEHNYDQALAGLSLYDVLLVNSLSDGMNLVSKEGALVNERDGVLVLSRAAGAFRELGDAALPIAPKDVAGTAQALADALAMPIEERCWRAARLRATVEANDFSDWFERQLSDLEEIAVARRHSVHGNGHASGNGQRALAGRAYN
jgi:trehalose 6-phosphate synthase